MSYAIKLNGFFYKGINCQGMAIYGTDVAEAKHYYDRQEAHRDNDEKVGGEVCLVPMWAFR
jgi:hypothetical protein